MGRYQSSNASYKIKTSSIIEAEARNTYTFNETEILRQRWKLDYEKSIEREAKKSRE